MLNKAAEQGNVDAVLGGLTFDSQVLAWGDGCEFQINVGGRVARYKIVQAFNHLKMIQSGKPGTKNAAAIIQTGCGTERSRISELQFSAFTARITLRASWQGPMRGS